MKEIKVSIISIILSFVIIGFGHLYADTIPIEPSNYNDIDAGSLENPFKISNLSNLLWLSETQEVWDIDGNHHHFIQTENIDASESEEWNNEEGFKPIGLKYDVGTNEPEWVEIPFTGNYNGNNKSISNLFINNQETARSYLGVFGFTDNASISNLEIVNANINTLTHGGLLIGNASNTAVTNCSSSGSITGTNFLSGFIGALLTGTVSRCSSSATINGVDNSGGIIGIAAYSQIESCFFKGQLNTTDVINGGLVGNLVEDSSLEFSYNAGIIQNTTNGILVGGIMSNSVINNCLWDNEVSNSTNPIELNLDGSGILNNTYGLTTEEMKIESNYIDNGWDFNEIWIIADGVNDGYPFFQPFGLGISNDVEILATKFSVTNYPNPFNPSTSIEFYTSEFAEVKVDIMNLKGQKVKTLIDEELSAGKHTVIWNGDFESNFNAPSGVYFYRLIVGNEQVCKKMILIK